MLTLEQKRDIIKYVVGGFETKPIMEDVITVNDTDELWDDVGEFLEECAGALTEWLENEHCKHLDRKR